MTYIKLMDDMRLVITQADTIYRGDNMSAAITFLLPLKVGELEVKASTVFLSYIRADGTPDIVLLEPKSTMYDPNHHMYVMPITCKLSRYPGEVFMWLQFYAGNSALPEVKKSGECTIRILESRNLDDCFADHQLSVLYQLKQKIDNCGCDSSGGSGGNVGGNTGSDEPDTPTPPAGDGILYYGTGVGAVPEVDSDLVCGLSNTVTGPTEGYSFSIDVEVGQQYIAFAYPATLRDVNNVTYVQANDSGMASSFTKHEVEVSDSGSAPVVYKVYTYAMAIPAMATMTFKVTI